jgi:thiol-disulfide isomerase/thioredoxin
LLWLAVIVAGLVALVVFGLSSQKSSTVGRVAPELPREQIAGPHATLASLRAGAGGRPVAVVFWASWCGPCVSEAPAIERFSRSSAGAGRVAGVNWSDALSGARAFVRRFGWTFPNLRDGDGVVGNRYDMTGLPTTFVINGRGRIAAVLRGPQTVASLRSALAGG